MRAARALLVACCVMFVGPAAATVIDNGDFSSGLAGWSSGGDTVSDGGGFALLELAANQAPNTSVCDGVPGNRCVFQTFQVMSTGPELLSFEFSFSTEPGAAAPGAGSFQASLLSDDFSDPIVDIVIVDEVFGVTPAAGVTASPNAPISGYTPIGSLLYSAHVELMLPAFLQGDLVTLYFDLLDASPINAISVAVDNVAVAAVQASAPATAILLLGALVLTGFASRSRTS